jgi:hypothetical protein
MEIISTRRNDHRNDPKGLSAQPEDEGHPERKAYPRACIVGHRDLSHDRDCPCFDAVKEYADIQPK